MTVAELLDRISSREIAEWMAFSQLEPFGSEAGYIGHAITAVTIANTHLGKGQKAKDVEDFMPKFGPKKEQTVDEMLQFAQMLTIGLGGKDLRGEKE